MVDFSNYRMIRLREVATIERARKGKCYPEGCILIALSATKGQVEYRADSGEADSKWAVVIPYKGNDPKYIYHSITRSFPEFLERYMTGINLQIDSLDCLEIALHPIREQKEIVRMLGIVEEKQKKEEHLLETWKEVKKHFLGKMF